MRPPSLVVPDLEATLAGLTERGIKVGPITEEAPNSFKAIIIDPDGNEVSLLQVPIT